MSGVLDLYGLASFFFLKKIKIKIKINQDQIKKERNRNSPIQCKYRKKKSGFIKNATRKNQKEKS